MIFIPKSFQNLGVVVLRDFLSIPIIIPWIPPLLGYWATGAKTSADFPVQTAVEPRSTLDESRIDLEDLPLLTEELGEHCCYLTRWHKSQFIYNLRFPRFDVPTASVPLQGITGIAPVLNSYLTSRYVPNVSTWQLFQQEVNFWNISLSGFFFPEASPSGGRDRDSP